METGNLEGYDEILKLLQELGNDKAINEILKKSNRDIITPLRNEMASSLSYAPWLKKEIRVRAAKVDGQSHPNAVMVGPTSDSFLIRFLDKGTVERYTKAGRYAGKITGKHEIEPFFDNKAPKIQKDAAKEYGEALVKQTEKYTKKITKKK